MTVLVAFFSSSFSFFSFPSPSFSSSFSTSSSPSMLSTLLFRDEETDGDGVVSPGRAGAGRRNCVCVGGAEDGGKMLLEHFCFTVLQDVPVKKTLTFLVEFALCFLLV